MQFRCNKCGIKFDSSKAGWDFDREHVFCEKCYVLYCEAIEIFIREFCGGKDA